jgi:sirohydrochlorin cobaltochelatase
MRSACPPDGVVLMGHGSRDLAGAREFLALSDAVGSLPEVAGMPVEPGFLEFAGRLLPSIQDAFDRCIDRGARRIAAVPAILFAGSHGTEDMPRQVSLARSRYPDVQVRQADLIGIDDALLDLLVERFNAATAGLPPLPADRTALLLVTSGSARREANADVFKAARLLADRADGRLVEVAFLRLARPYLQDAARRCVRLGARRVVVLPLLVNTGLLARRVPRKLVWLRRELPSVEFVEAPYLGIDPALAALLARRAFEAFDQDRDGPLRTPVRLAPGQERCRPRWAGHAQRPVVAGSGRQVEAPPPHEAREREGVPAA